MPRLKAYTRRRLAASAKLGAAAVPLAVAIRSLHGALTPGTVLIGFAGGFMVGAAELFWLRRRFRTLGFIPHLLVKSIAILAILYGAFLALNLLDVFLEDVTWSVYAEVALESETLIGLLEVFGIITFLLFFVHLDRLLGPGVLVGLVTGRFHRPRRESRIFMFLDLKGSTALADTLEAERYFAFMHRYFSEMAEPILEANAEIYQYVGDEVVLSWSMEDGLEDAACVHAFFLIQDRIASQRSAFLSEYGTVPEFKAGMHAGEVVVAQIGELKSEIVYSGDVLNTTARIQALCNELGHPLLVSRGLADELSLGPEYVVEPLGAFHLRGKGEPVSLTGIRRAPTQSPVSPGR